MAGQIGLALFGLGRAGKIHLKNINQNPQTVLLWVVDADTKTARTVLDQYFLHDVRVAKPDQTDSLFADKRVDAVIISTPTYTHEEYVHQALSHKKAVFCEKPLAENLERTAACYEEAAKVGLPLMVSFNRRFDPTFRQLYHRVKAGEVGQVQMIKICSRDSPLPSMDYLKISGGIFHDCAVHDIDMLCWLTGECPQTVFTQAHAFHQGIAAMQDVDTVAMVMKFPSGIIATIDLSRCAVYGYDQRIEVFGSEGMLTADHQHKSSTVAYNRQGTHSDTLKYSFPERYAQGYVDSLQHFVNVIQGKESLEVTSDAILQVSRIATACEISCKTKLPVEVSKVKL